MNSLEALKKINHDRFIEEFYNQEYNQIETSLKALEIIKEKEIDVMTLLNNNLEKYNYYAERTMGNDKKLTQEDFDKVKKELEK